MKVVVTVLVFICVVFCQIGKDSINNESSELKGYKGIDLKELNAKKALTREEFEKRQTERVHRMTSLREAKDPNPNDDDDDGNFTEIMERGNKEILKHMESRHPKTWDKDLVPLLFEKLDSDKTLNKKRVQNMHFKWDRYLEKMSGQKTRFRKHDEL